MSNSAVKAIGRWFRDCPAPLLYSIGFVIIGAIAFSPLLIYGKSIINNIDGITQYSRYVVIGQTIRQAFADLLNGQGFFLPTYDLSMGYGQPMTYSFDPLIYTSALLPADQTEPLFCAIGIARIWIAGLAFLGLCRVLPISRNWSVLSALVYAFSSASLNCFLQVWDVNQMIFFPLVIWGAVLLLKQRRPYVYVAASAGMFLICGIYFSYMAHLMVAAFAATYLAVHRSSLRRWGFTVLAFLASLAVAFVIAAPVSFSQLATLASAERVSIDYAVPTLYPARYYQQLVAAFLGMRFGECDWFFGYGGLALTACAFLLPDRGSRATAVLKILLIAGTLVFCIPALGSLTNGMAYAANRWSFGFALLIACIVGTVGTRWEEAQRAHLVVAACILAAYTLLMAFLPEARGKEAWLQLAVAWIIWALVPIAKAVKHPQAEKAQRVAKTCIAAVSAIALGANMFLFLSPFSIAHWQYRLFEQGTAFDRIAAKTPAMLMKQETGNGLVRYDRSSNHYWDVVTYGLLAPRVLGTYGIDFYNNYYDNLVDSFHRDLAVLDNCMTMAYTTLDQRAALETVLGAGYYATSTDDTLPLPYGTDPIPVGSVRGADGAVYELHSIEGETSLALVYDNAIEMSLWNQLTPLERQEAMLQGVFLEETGDGAITPAFTGREIDCRITDADGVQIQDGSIVAMKDNATLTIGFEPQPKAELYLYAKGVSLEPSKPNERYTEEQWEALGADERAQIQRASDAWEPVEAFAVTVETEGSKGKTSIPTPANHLYGGKDTWLWNTGYSDEGASTLTMEFSIPGTYSFDEFSVLAQPMGSLDDARQRIAGSQVQNLAYERDTISFDIDDARGGQIAFLSVPYDECWHAAVNGHDLEIKRANGAFMAVRLPEGDCSVVFTYHSRLPLRIAIGALTALFVAGLWAMNPKRRHQPMANASI